LHQSQRNGTSRNTRKTRQKHTKNAQNWQILATNTTTRGSIHGNFHRCDKVFSARSQKLGQSAHPQPVEIAENAPAEQVHSFCEAHFWH
jgi:hypothetical protein